MVLIELQEYLIFFHFVPDVQHQGNYSEMFMYALYFTSGGINTIVNTSDIFDWNIHSSDICHF